MKAHHSLAIVMTVMLTCVACSRTREVNHSPSTSSGGGEIDSIQNVSEEQSSPNIKSSSGTDVSAPFESLDVDINAVTSEAIVPQPKLTEVPEIEDPPQSSELPPNSPSDDVDTDVMTGVSLAPEPAELSIPSDLSDVDTNAFTGEESVPLPELSPEPMDTDAFTEAQLVPQPMDTDAFTEVQLAPQPDRSSFDPTLLELMLEPEPTEAIAVDVVDDALPKMSEETHIVDDVLPKMPEETRIADEALPKMPEETHILP